MTGICRLRGFHGFLRFHEAFLLLCGMKRICANLRIGGLYERAAQRTASVAFRSMYDSNAFVAR